MKSMYKKCIYKKSECSRDHAESEITQDHADCATGIELMYKATTHKPDRLKTDIESSRFLWMRQK